MSGILLSTLILSLKLACFTTVLLLLFSFPIALLIHHKKNLITRTIDILISMPLVLPPTVLGFYLLIIFSPNTFIGYFFSQILKVKILFSFTGILLASFLYSLPFMFNPLKDGLVSIDKNLLNASYLLGKSKIYTFFKILVPNMKNYIFTGVVTAFTHTIGAFGVVLMVGGNIPKKTKVISIALFEKVDELEYSTANTYSVFLLIISFLTLFIIQILKEKKA